MPNEVAVRKPTNFEITLDQYAPQIQAVLPPHVPLARFKRVVMTAVSQNPDLLKADQRSLFNSCIRAAQDGLLPDGRESALVVFQGKVQYLRMVYGIRKLMRQSGEVDDANAYVVYQKDHFDYRLGDNPMIDHKPPALAEDRGKPIGAYAIIRLKNGEIIREVMNHADIEKVRSVSRSKDGPGWTKWWDEFARKSVLRRASKAAPTSEALDNALRSEDEFEPHENPSQEHNLPPPRPTLAHSAPVDADPQPQEPVHLLVDHVGDLVGEFTGAEWIERLSGLVADAADPKVIVALWANNEENRPTGREAQEALAGVIEAVNESKKFAEINEADPVALAAAIKADDAAQQQATRDPFWAGESLTIPAPKRKGSSSTDWAALADLLGVRIGEATTRAELMKLDTDNTKNFGGLKIANRDLAQQLRDAITARAETFPAE